LNRPRVLLADEDRALLEGEIALLSPHFVVVGTAADGAALVSKARSLHPDVIVTDVSMPIVNGIEAVQKIRESGSKAMFVFLTEHSEGVFAKACPGAGALGYVHKSNMKGHLVPSIQAILAIRALLRDQFHVSQFNSAP